MAILCNTNCGIPPQPPTKYDDGCNDVFRNFGTNHLIFLTCDYQFTNILSATEWAAAIAANKIHISPEGTVTVGAPTSTAFPVTGCRREVSGPTEYTIDFETYQTADNLDDFLYFEQLCTGTRQLRVMLVDCDGNFYLERDWAAEVFAGGTASIPNSSPGYEFSLTQAPSQVSGEQNYAKWTMQIKIKTNCMLGMALLPGVQSVLA